MLTSQSDEVRYVLEKLLAKIDPAGERHREDYGLFLFDEVCTCPHEGLEDILALTMLGGMAKNGSRLADREIRAATHGECLKGVRADNRWLTLV